MSPGRRSELEANEGVKDKIKTAQMLTVISWCTYSFMYLFQEDQGSCSSHQAYADLLFHGFRNHHGDLHEHGR